MAHAVHVSISNKRLRPRVTPFLVGSQWNSHTSCCYSKNGFTTLSPTVLLVLRNILASTLSLGSLPQRYLRHYYSIVYPDIVLNAMYFFQTAPKAKQFIFLFFNLLFCLPKRAFLAFQLCVSGFILGSKYSKSAPRGTKSTYSSRILKSAPRSTKSTSVAF